MLLCSGWFREENCKRLLVHTALNIMTLPLITFMDKVGHNPKVNFVWLWLKETVYVEIFKEKSSELVSLGVPF